MDKYEYQVCSDQIKALIKERRFTEAMDIADTIDWRRVKSFSMLCTVSEIYKVTKHYSEARDILLLAYERYPDRANVLYALCELAIKLDDINEAAQYYKDYVRLRPHDSSKYVLLYKMYEANDDVTLEDKISLLEEFKRADYSDPKWAYELALLYHKAGDETKCVAECDELAIWFGDGAYVRKAFELKMQHAPLTRDQQKKYDGIEDAPAAPKTETEETVHIYETQSISMPGSNTSDFETSPIGMSADKQPVKPVQSQPMIQQQIQQTQAPASNQPAMGSSSSSFSTQDIKIAPVGTDKYSTLSLQEELAKNMEELYAKEKGDVAAPYYGTTSQLYEPSQQQFIQQINQAGPIQGQGMYQQDPSGMGQAFAGGYQTDPLQQSVQPSYPQMSDPYQAQVQAPYQQMSDPYQAQVQAPYPQMGDPYQAQAPYQQMGDPYQAQAPYQQMGNPYQQPVQTSYQQPQDSYQQPVQTPYQQPQDSYQQPVQTPYQQPQDSYQQPVQTPYQAQPQVSYQQPVDTYQPQVQESYQQPSEATAIEPARGDTIQPSEDNTVQQTIGETASQQVTVSEESTVPESTNERVTVSANVVGVPKGMEDKLREGLDGQVTLALPNSQEIEEQIPGQIDISDFMADWEAKKKKGEEQRKEQIKARSLEQTSDILSKLEGVIPGFDTIKKDIQEDKKEEPEAETPEDNKVVSGEEIIRDDKKGVVTKTTIASPSFDRETSVKRSESGAKINGPVKSSITGEIPDFLPSAPVKEVPKVDMEEVPEAISIPEPKLMEQTEVSDAEEPEVQTADINNAESDDSEVSETNNQNLCENIESEEISDTVETDEEESAIEESAEEDSVEELPEITVPKEILESIPDVDCGEIEEDIEDVEQPDVELDIDDKKQPEEIYNPTGEIPPLVVDEPAESDEQPEEPSDMADADDGEEESSEDAEEPITYPYNVDDMGEVEELEMIDQPDEVDDILKTRPIPVEEIEARQRYEAGIEDEYREDGGEVEKKPSHPSYMVMDDARTSSRDFDEVESAILGRYEGIESLKAQIVDVLDDMSMDPRHGNIIVMGSELFGRKALAVDLIKTVKALDSKLTGIVVRISGEALNKKNIPVTFNKFKNGALVVENAGGLTPVTINAITDTLLASENPMIVIFEDEKEALEPLINGCSDVKNVFNAKIVMEDFNNDDLVAYAKGYARELEYSIDEMGTLALHTRIADMQTIDHVVSVDEVIDIVDAAIKHVDRKNMSHFMDVLLAKRYDEEDFIVLREKDFMG